ncbi:M1 family aminopeptidase [Leucobacter sp. 1207-22]|uniref:M1 family aminopeptidase n=1 Tax=Leucobacter sp. 1207-22 TaxID=2604456 RepID=UPI0040634B01
MPDLALTRGKKPRQARDTPPPALLKRATRIASAGVLACSLAALGSTAAQAAPIDGGPSIGDSLFSGIGNTGYDALHYDVKIDYVNEETAERLAGSIVATSTMTARAETELKSFSLDFEGLEIDSLLVNGEPATYERTADKPSEAFKLIITPQQPVSGEFTVEVNYSGIPEKHIDNDGSPEGWVATADGTTALGQPVGTMTWIPSNNTPADKATFDFAITIPTEILEKPAAAASNGELISQDQSDDGSRTTWVWSQKNQMATMATMLSIGNFDVVSDEITLSDGRKIPEWSFIDSSLPDAGKATIEQRRQEIEEITQTLEKLYGPYPGNSTGIVVDVNPVGYALETQDRSFFPGSVSKGTLVHEIAHQWFGDGVSPADWNSIWISEGQASFASAYYNEVHGIPISNNNPATSTAARYFAMWESTPADHSRWTVPPTGMTAQTQLFDWQTYNRGAMTYAALREVLGDDVFTLLMTGWPQEHLGGSFVTDDFIAYAEEISGKDLSAFFAAWLAEPAKPAWPSVWNLTFSASPEEQTQAASIADTSTQSQGLEAVAPGATVNYSFQATNTGLVPLTGTASVDLTSALPYVTLDASKLGSAFSLDGNLLTWTLPEAAPGESVSATFPLVVKADAFSASFTLTPQVSLGGFAQAQEVLIKVMADPNPGTDANAGGTANGEGTAEGAVTPGTKFPLAPDAKKKDPALANTGGADLSSWALGGAVVLLLVGSGVVATARRKAMR